MSMIFFTFRSYTAAKQGLGMLKKRGISGKIGRTPGLLAVHGCGYGLWVQETRGTEAAEILREKGQLYEKSYKITGKIHQEVVL